MALSQEQVAALLAPRKSRTAGKKRVRFSPEKLDQADLRGPDIDDVWIDELTFVDYERIPITTRTCEGCGHCEYPGKCAASTTCPLCGSSPKQLCTEGSRVVGYHRERWHNWPIKKVTIAGKKTTVSEVQLIYKALMKMGVITSDGSV